MNTPIYDLGLILSAEELDQLRCVIKSNTQLWTHESTYWGENHIRKPIYFLGSPIYPAKSIPPLYCDLREKTKQFLIDNTTSIISKILNLVGEMFHRRIVEHLPNTSLPGFHIFRSIEPCREEYEYHQDADFLEFTNATFDFNDFYSFVAIIELPSAGGSLDYKMNNKHQALNYINGHAYVWKSDIWHKIGDVILTNENDYRITFQGHFIVQPDKILYYW